MKSLKEFLAEKREVTFHTLASYSRQYLEERWQPVLEEHEEELQHVFAKAGEVAYGVYGRALLQPLQDQFQQAGFFYEGGNFSTSVEHWGPPEERERCMWSIVKQAQGGPLGTLVFRIFHDHTQFRLPHPPGILVLEETVTSAIIDTLSHASARQENAQYERTFQQKTPDDHTQNNWEYSVELGLADYLDSHRLEVSEAMIDHALSRWGNYGWELASIVPYQNRLVAFFKRPLKEQTK
jgi:hypothetical protein